MERKCILVIRIRGGINVSRKNEDTLRMLRVDRNNYATFLDDRPEYKGMLQRAKDQVTWGEPTVETVKLVLEKRGKIWGDKPIDAETLNKLGYDNLDSLASAIHSGEVAYHKLEGIKPFFRLTPPSKGFKNTVKKAYNNKGELAYRGDAINALVTRMV